MSVLEESVLMATLSVVAPFILALLVGGWLDSRAAKRKEGK